MCARMVAIAHRSLARSLVVLLAVAAAVVLPPAAQAAPPDAFRVATPMAAGLFDTATAAYRDAGFDYVTNELGIPYNAAPVLQMALLSPG